VIKIRNILFTILIVILFASNLGFSAELPRVAVIGFDSTSPGYLWSIDSELSKAATDLMINALVNTNRFRVFERNKLEAILQEQDFQVSSGRVDPSTAVKIGKMIGVDSIVTGSVTSIMFSKSGGITLGPVNLKKSVATVTIMVRAINVTTGEIIFSEVKKGITSKSGVSLRIPVPVVGGLGLSSQSVVDIFSAIEDVCQQVAVEFAAKIDSNVMIASSSSFSLEGYVVKVDSTSSGEITQVYINLGVNSGIKVGDEIKISQEGEVILDPKTQEVLDRELILVAQASIIQVKENISIALVTTKFSNLSIMPTDIVQVIR
jgi:curli biogenesis system outer membrane secretion channel CsgG